jgi:hypothetical protein
VNLLPASCPICGNDELTITGFFCRECDTRVEGRFLLNSPFTQLDPEQLAFVETFVRCEGKLNRMEAELNLSYPTIRSRLHEIIRAMGYEPGKEELPILKEKDREEILAALERGEIDYTEAMRLLGSG